MAHLCCKMNFLKFSFFPSTLHRLCSCSPSHLSLTCCCYVNGRSLTFFHHFPCSLAWADVLNKCQMKQHRWVFPEAWTNNHFGNLVTELGAAMNFEKSLFPLKLESFPGHSHVLLYSLLGSVESCHWRQSGFLVLQFAKGLIFYFQLLLSSCC